MKKLESYGEINKIYNDCYKDYKKIINPQIFNSNINSHTTTGSQVGTSYPWKYTNTTGIDPLPEPYTFPDPKSNEFADWFEKIKRQIQTIVTTIKKAFVRKVPTKTVCNVCNQTVPKDLPVFTIDQSITDSLKGIVGTAQINICPCCLMELSQQTIDQVKEDKTEDLLDDYTTERFVSHL